MLAAASCEIVPSAWWDFKAIPTVGRARREFGKATQPVRCIFRVKTVRDLNVLPLTDVLREKHVMARH